MLSFANIDIHDPAYDDYALHTDTLDLGDGTFETVTMPMHCWYTLDYIHRVLHKNLFLKFKEVREAMEPGRSFQDALTGFLFGYLSELQDVWREEDAKASAAQ